VIWVPGDVHMGEWGNHYRRKYYSVYWSGREIVMLVTFLLQPYSLIEICNNVQNRTFPWPEETVGRVALIYVLFISEGRDITTSATPSLETQHNTPFRHMGHACCLQYQRMTHCQNTQLKPTCIMCTYTYDTTVTWRNMTIHGVLDLLNTLTHNSWLCFINRMSHRPIQNVKILTSRCLVAASNGEHFHSSGFPTYPF
jgi:hypothetical protein